MIVLDTNVASELSKTSPNSAVIAWFAGQDVTDLYLTAINEAELQYGVEILPDSRRRRELAAANDVVIRVMLGDRVLSFDRESARPYGEIRAYRERIGYSIQERDCMIASIARAHGAAVATRDTSGFENCGIEVINPWES